MTAKPYFCIRCKSEVPENAPCPRCEVSQTPLDALDDLMRLILGEGSKPNLSAARERVMDMMAVIAACDDAFSNAQLDEDHVEHIIHSHSDSIFDYYRVLAKDLRPADKALADYNNKLCDEMEARAAAKGGPRG